MFNSHMDASLSLSHPLSLYFSLGGRVGVGEANKKLKQKQKQKYTNLRTFPDSQI